MAGSDDQERFEGHRSNGATGLPGPTIDPAWWLNPVPLAPTFMARPVTMVARSLLGKIILRELNGELMVARIVETEAYAGDVDEASHSFKGQTPRNQSMFGPAGRAYVYRSYGIHFMLNVVTTEPGGPACAVLLRGASPQLGLRLMAARRGSVLPEDLLRGPGNLAAGLAIDPTLDGHDLHRAPLRIVEGPLPDEPVVVTTRIGITRSAQLPWRYYLLGSHGVSRRNRLAEQAAIAAS